MFKNNDIVTISAESLKEMIKQDKKVKVINVLDEQTYQDCHIQGSINIPIDQLVDKTSSWDKDKVIVVYCASSTCPKSSKAYHLLKELGFTNLSEYPGGTKEWLQKEFATSGACSLKYLNEK